MSIVRFGSAVPPERVAQVCAGQFNDITLSNYDDPDEDGADVFEVDGACYSHTFLQQHLRGVARHAPLGPERWFSSVFPGNPTFVNTLPLKGTASGGRPLSIAQRAEVFAPEPDPAAPGQPGAYADGYLLDAYAAGEEAPPKPDGYDEALAAVRRAQEEETRLERAHEAAIERMEAVEEVSQQECEARFLWCCSRREEAEYESYGRDSPDVCLDILRKMSELNRSLAGEAPPGYTPFTLDVVYRAGTETDIAVWYPGLQTNFTEEDEGLSGACIAARRCNVAAFSFGGFLAQVFAGFAPFNRQFQSPSGLTPLMCAVGSSLRGPRYNRDYVDLLLVLLTGSTGERTRRALPPRYSMMWPYPTERTLESDRVYYATDESGDTALHIAAAQGNEDAIIALLDYERLAPPAGAPERPLCLASNAPDADGCTPLMKACQHRNLAVVRWLNEARVAPAPPWSPSAWREAAVALRQDNVTRYTALHLAVVTSGVSLKHDIVDYLAAFGDGGELTARDNRGNTALQCVNAINDWVMAHVDDGPPFGIEQWTQYTEAVVDALTRALLEKGVMTRSRAKKLAPRRLFEDDAGAGS